MKIFNEVKQENSKRSFFDLTHSFKFTGNMGDLIPVCCIDAVVGGTYKLGGEAMTRLAPMVAPPMEKFKNHIEYFAVPKRILWQHFEKWTTGKTVGGVPPTFPTITIHGNGDNYTKLMDYFGIPNPTTDMPMGVEHDEVVNAMPFAAYQMIFDEYYRDQNLENPVLSELGSGDDREWYLNDGTQNATEVGELTKIRKRCWSHDYFTSCLPTPQAGDPVSLPVGAIDLPDTPVRKNTSSTGGITTLTGTPANALVANHHTTDPVGDDYLYAETHGSYPVDSTTITDLRRAYALQRYKERLMMVGSRFVEWCRGIFGVRISDNRMHRPEMITRVTSDIVVSEVLNTTGTADAPQGNMAGHGIGLAIGKWGSFFVEEPSYIIGIYSVQQDGSYFQGIPKHFTKYSNPEEHFLPQFEHIGEQPVVLREICAYQDDTNENTVFGYLPRYSEYKFENNRIAGDFKTSLEFWTASRKFDDVPVLNKAFIKYDEASSNKIFAVESGTDHLWVQLINHVQAILPMSKFSTPY